MSKSLAEQYKTQAQERIRVADLGLQIGKFPRGRLNQIVDVPGIKVGHKTLIEGTGKRRPGTGPIRTGVTVIHPNDNIFQKKLFANSFILNGAGEMSGITQVKEWGLIETPIALTNTMSVGRVSDAIVEWMASKNKDILDGKQVVIPVVGECDDSFLNDSAGLHVKKTHVLEAIKSAKATRFLEGSVGAGTGMVCCDFKGGIGSSSRVLRLGEKDFAIGVMVLSNFGVIDDFRMNGIPMGSHLMQDFADMKKRRENYGSIITVIATNIPLSVIQLERISKRAALGIGRVGSYAAHGSGEIILSFSTANHVDTRRQDPFFNVEMLKDVHINPVYEATIEATEEAILNSMLQSVDMSGVEDHFVPSLPTARVKEIISQYAGLRG